MGQRQRIHTTDDWQQLDLLVRFPEQHTYELIRPVVLFGHSPAERARLTGAPQRTLYRQAARFEREGMASLFGPPKLERHRTLPEEIQQAIRVLKAEHPSFHYHEIATICGVRFGRRPSHHTVRRILAEDPLPLLIGCRFPPYHQIADAVERRCAVLKLHSEGWTVTSIAAYLQVDRHTIYDTLKRWVAEGVAGLADTSHARTDGVRKVDLPMIAAVKRLQENPELGAFRMHAALKLQGIELSPRTCGRIMARNRKLYGLAKPARAPHTATPQPFAAVRRHQYWSVDIRHLDMANIGMKVYCISILDV
jgi:putative transposase